MKIRTAKYQCGDRVKFKYCIAKTNKLEEIEYNWYHGDGIIIGVFNNESGIQYYIKLDSVMKSKDGLEYKNVFAMEHNII